MRATKKPNHKGRRAERLQIQASWVIDPYVDHKGRQCGTPYLVAVAALKARSIYGGFN